MNLHLAALTTRCASIILIQVRYYKIQRLKVGRVWSSLHIQSEFDDITRLGFVSYSKELEGVCSTGCAFVACSVPCLHSSL